MVNNKRRTKTGPKEEILSNIVPKFFHVIKRKEKWLWPVDCNMVTPSRATVNVNTPILHLNGLSDPIVPLIPAGSKSKVVMEEIFSNYELWTRLSTTHTTTMGPQNIPTVRRWLRKNTNINFSSLNNLVGKIPGFGSLGFGKWFKLADDPHLWNLWRKDVRNRLIIVLLL